MKRTIATCVAVALAWLAGGCSGQSADGGPGLPPGYLPPRYHLANVLPTALALTVTGTNATSGTQLPRGSWRQWSEPQVTLAAPGFATLGLVPMTDGDTYLAYARDPSGGTQRLGVARTVLEGDKVKFYLFDGPTLPDQVVVAIAPLGADLVVVSSEGGNPPFQPQPAVLALFPLGNAIITVQGGGTSRAFVIPPDWLAQEGTNFYVTDDAELGIALWAHQAQSPTSTAPGPSLVRLPPAS